MAAAAQRLPRIPDVAPRWHLGGTTRPRLARWGRTFAPSPRGRRTVPAHYRRASLAHNQPRSAHRPQAHLRSGASSEWPAAARHIHRKTHRNEIPETRCQRQGAIKPPPAGSREAAEVLKSAGASRLVTRRCDARPISRSRGGPKRAWEDPAGNICPIPPPFLETGARGGTFFAWLNRSAHCLHSVRSNPRSIAAI
jgi:hypothetical protein